MIRSTHLWAIGAIAVSVLIACSPSTPPPAPAEPAQPTPQSPVLSGAESTLGPPPASIAPGFADTWAVAEADCATPAKTVRLTSEAFTLMEGEGSCKVKSISEEHPTGRSMNYTVIADCVSPARTGEDTFRINFGASDTVMQFQQNAREPVRLTRCPPAQQP